MSGNPPPPPPTPQNPRDKISPSVQKLRSVPPDHYIQASKPPAHVDIDPPTGPYFFYGTLMDPSILSAVLDLDPAAAEQRKADFDLRPAYIVGYECKLWGQYPALVDGPGFSSIEGAVFQVRTVQEGKRLAEYETANYRTTPCQIRSRDGKHPDIENGHVFVFAGDRRELSEGTFDLQVWLRRMGRGGIVDELNSKSSS